MATMIRPQRGHGCRGTLLTISFGGQGWLHTGDSAGRDGVERTSSCNLSQSPPMIAFLLRLRHTGVQVPSAWDAGQVFRSEKHVSRRLVKETR